MDRYQYHLVAYRMGPRDLNADHIEELLGSAAIERHFGFPLAWVTPQ
jgi:hypothetical protein